MPRTTRSRHAALLLACALFAAVAPAQDPLPPNVVVVLVDDLGWTDLACQGSGYYETPNIDRLAAGGIRFTDAYAACAVCSPTRAALLTGRSPARTGVTDWIRARFQRGGLGTPARNPTDYVGGRRQRLLCPPNPYWMEHEEVTIAEVLGRAGYATCHVGKWHLGDDDHYPESQGFAENFGGCDYGQPPSYFDPYRTERLPQGIPTLAPRRTGEYLTDREAAEAAAFIRRNRTRPFFLYYAPYAVHTPIQAKEDLVEHYRAKPKTSHQNPAYAAMIHALDEAVGRILDALEDTGLGERTLVVFTSDNGGLLGPTDNTPLRSGKGFPHEGGIRVPLIARWPGVIEPGRVSNTPVTTVDWFPTLVEATGAAVAGDRAGDGLSLLTLLRGGGEPLPARPLFWHFPHYRGSLGPYGIVRDGRWKLIVHYEGPTFELYDLAADLGEQRDLAAEQPDRVRQMHRQLTDYLDQAGARLPRPNPNYEPRQRVLLLGDSISIGYTDRVRQLLEDAADVFRPMRDASNPENCAGTTHGLQRIDDWLAADGGEWDLIHFNFGLHDLKRVDPTTGRNSDDPSHPRQAEPAVYERQLREIVARLERTGAHLVFATTTPVPPGGVRPHRDVDDVRRYNDIARAIMNERGIPIDDLYAFASPRLAEIQQPANVHFSAAGSAALAARVADQVRGALPAGTAAFRHDPARVRIGTAYHYRRSDIDGSHASRVSAYVAGPRRLEAVKWSDAPGSAIVADATIDWRTFSLHSLHTLSLAADGSRTSLTRLEAGDDDRVGYQPWHSLELDLLGFGLTLPHLLDPERPFTIGIADAAGTPTPAFAFKGRIAVRFVGREERHGEMCRRYVLQGPGLDNRGGVLWASIGDPHIVDLEIEPGGPGQHDGKLRLLAIEPMSEAAWDSFVRERPH